MVLGEVTPSWSSFTRGSAVGGLRLTAEPMSLCPELDLVLEMGLDLELDVNGSEGIFILGLGAADDEDDEEDGLGVSGLPADSLEMGLLISPELRLGLELLWWSEEDLILGVEAEAGLGVDETLGLGAVDGVAILGLDIGLLGLTLLLFSLSLRWLL